MSLFVKRLAILSPVTFGDYLLWNWALGHNHDIIALIAGLTLPPLAILLLLMLTLRLARALAGSRGRARQGALVRAARRRVSPDGSPRKRRKEINSVGGSTRRRGQRTEATSASSERRAA